MGQNHIKIGVGLSISRSLVFKVKKLLDDVPDLMLLQRGGKKRSWGMRADLMDLGCQSLVSAAVQVSAYVNQEFLGKHVVAWVHRTYPDGKYVFWQI
jgi:hypothetical protein